jgi:hypothetical protein
MHALGELDAVATALHQAKGDVLDGQPARLDA